MIAPEVHVSKGVPSFTALRIPKGMEIRYAATVDHRPSVIETGIFSSTRSTTLIERK